MRFVGARSSGSTSWQKAPTADFLRRSSLTYLECCIAVMLTHLGHEEVAAILEREAKDLRG